MVPSIKIPNSEESLSLVNRAKFNQTTCDLPEEVLNEILKCLCLDTLADVKLVSKNLYNLAVNLWSARWRIRCGNEFPLSKQLNDRIEINWFKLFSSLNALKAKVRNMPTPSQLEIKKKLDSFQIKDDIHNRILDQGSHLFILSNYPSLMEGSDDKSIQCIDEFRKVQKARNQALFAQYEAIKCLKLAAMENVPEAITILTQLEAME